LADLQRTVYPQSGHPLAEGRAQDRVSSPAKDGRYANCATQPTNQPTMHMHSCCRSVSSFCQEFDILLPQQCGTLPSVLRNSSLSQYLFGRRLKLIFFEQINTIYRPNVSMACLRLQMSRLTLFLSCNA